MATYYMDLEGGDDDANFTVDQSPAHRVTTAVGTGALSSSVSKFGGTSLATTNSGSGTGLSVPSSSDFDFGAGPFCIEGWMYFTGAGVANCCLVSRWQTSGTFALYMDGGQFYMRFYDTGNSIIDTNGTWAPAATTWYYVCAERDDSGVVRISVGTSGTATVIASATRTQTIRTGSNRLTVGFVDDFAGTFNANGYIDSLRITRAQRYGAAPAVPTSEWGATLADDALYGSVVLLCNFPAKADAGTSFTRRWKTFASGATAARTAPGDTIRIMASPNPTLVGDATWTAGSKTITLAGAVTANIATCETAWTASANVTCSTTSSGKEGTNAASSVIASGFTTGKASYFATGTLDLSGYQQVSFWFTANAAIVANTLSLRLCTDTAGATSVHTVPIPVNTRSDRWMRVTVDLGANMNSAIASVALYQDVDIAAVTVILDNIIACKASSAADSLSLTSLIGKVWGMNWVASTTYASNAIRKPTSPNRNGYRYKVTAGGGGASGSSEPAWPLRIGSTVSDGALTWTCDALEDTWHSIRSINGTTLSLDGGPNTSTSNVRTYTGDTETVATYKRETIKQATVSNFTGLNVVQESGTLSSPITYTGGWSRTDMATQTGETWIDGQIGEYVYGWYLTGRSFVVLDNVGAVNCNHGVVVEFFTGCTVKNVHCNNSQGTGILIGTGTTVAPTSVLGAALHSNVDGLVTDSTMVTMRAITASSNFNNGIRFAGGQAQQSVLTGIVAKNNGSYGIGATAAQGVLRIDRLTTSLNISAGVQLGGDLVLSNSSVTDTTKFSSMSAGSNVRALSQRDGAVADVHVITTDGGTIISATDQRHTASGISWKFRPTSTTRNSIYPLRLSVAKVAVASGGLVTINIWTRRDNTNIAGMLLLPGGQIAGAGGDLTVSCAPTINTWVQSGDLTFTPTEDGVVEVFFLAWDGVGTTNSFWIDDVSITQV